MPHGPGLGRRAWTRRPTTALLAALVAVTGLAGCRETPAPLAPIVTGTRVARPQDGSPTDNQVPMLRSLTFRRQGDAVIVDARFVPRAPHLRPVFDPYTPGGWCFQLFINSDRGPSGYWLGYDYLVRSVELSSDGSMPIRRTTGEPEGPGGWGAVRAEVTLDAHGMMMEFPLPVAALDGADAFDYAFETYATVPCADCAEGYAHAYVADYFGASDQAANGPLAFDSPSERRTPGHARGSGRVTR